VRDAGRTVNDSHAEHHSCNRPGAGPGWARARREARLWHLLACGLMWLATVAVRLSCRAALRCAAAALAAARSIGTGTGASCGAAHPSTGDEPGEHLRGQPGRPTHSLFEHGRVWPELFGI